MTGTFAVSTATVAAVPTTAPTTIAVVQPCVANAQSSKTSFLYIRLSEALANASIRYGVARGGRVAAGFAMDRSASIDSGVRSAESPARSRTLVQ
ncbi:MAG: hypothetical protein C0629_00255 [Chromatiales bacterium]|nr:MAG: hypothetical protein C0629_00255 [Chromatiales bacterium]